MSDAHTGGATHAQFSRVAIVGAGTLKGKELAEVLGERKFPALEVKLLDDEESLGQLEAVGEEVSFVQAASRDQFTNLDIAFFASDAKFARTTWKNARDAGALVIDLSYALEGEAGAQVRAPWLEQELGIDRFGSEPDLIVVAHPAAITLSLLMARLQRAMPVTMAVANIFEPASEQGRKGMDELHQQTVNLLSFQEMPKAVFDTQLAFAMLPRYGAQSQVKLEDTEQRILAHYRAISRRDAVGREAVRHTLVAGEQQPRPAHIGPTGAAAQEPRFGGTAPSLAVFQAPIFHSHVISLFVELEREVTPADVAQALTGQHVAIISAEEEPPTNVSAAGESAIQLAVRRDPARDDAVWLWAAADNLKISALNAVACAESALATRPKGRIQ